MVSDTGFTDDSSRWTDTETLKIIPHYDFSGAPVIVGITGAASQLNLMRAYLHHRDEKSQSISGSQLGMFEFVKGWNKFCSKLGVMTGPDIERTFAMYHVVVEDTAWSVQGFFVTQILDWECMGSGDPYARAAMYLGHSCLEAAEAAAVYDLYCESPLVSLSYDRKSKKISEKTIHETRVLPKEEVLRDPNAGRSVVPTSRKQSRRHAVGT
jgi:hypothetical protein